MNRVQRFRYNVSTDTGNWVDTGPVFFGRVLQVRWVQGDTGLTGDTGSSLNMVLAGSGAVVFNHPTALGPTNQWAPRQLTHDVTGSTNLYGADTGSSVPDYIYSAGEGIRVTVDPPAGKASTNGTLYVWVGSD